MLRQNSEQTWISWFGEQEAVVGLEKSGSSEPLAEGLYVIIGHALLQPGEARQVGDLPGDARKQTYLPILLGAFSSEYPRAPISWERKLDYLEVLRLVGSELTPFVTFKLETRHKASLPAERPRKFSTDEPNKTGVIMINSRVNEGGLGPDLAFTSVRNPVADDSTRTKDQIWVRRYDIDVPEEDEDGQLGIISVWPGRRIHPGSADAIKISTGATMKSETPLEENEDTPSFRKKLLDERVTSMSIDIEPPIQAPEAIHDLLVGRLNRGVKQFHLWHDVDGLAGKAVDDLKDAVADFLESGWKRRFQQDPELEMIAPLDRVVHESKSSLSVDIEACFLTDLINGGGQMDYDPSLRRLSVAGLGAGDQIIFFDRRQRQFLANGELSQECVVFEADEKRLFFRPGAYSPDDSQLVSFRIRVASEGREGRDAAGHQLSAPLGPWLNENGAKQAMDRNEPVLLAIAQEAGIAFRSENSVLRWSDFERDPAAVHLAKLLCPALEAIRCRTRDGTESVIQRALHSLGIESDTWTSMSTDTEISALEFLWSQRHREGFQKLVEIGAEIAVDTPGNARKLKGLIDRIETSREDARHIGLDTSSYGIDETSELAVLVADVGTRRTKVENLEEALQKLENLIEFDKNQNSNDEFDATRAVSSLATIDQKRQTYQQYIEKLKDAGPSGATAALLQKYEDDFNRCNDEVPLMLDKLLNTMQINHSTVLEPHMDQGIRELQDKLTRTAGLNIGSKGGVSDTLDMLRASKRRPASLYSDWTAWRTPLDDLDGFSNATLDTKQNLEALSEASKSHTLYCECIAILTDAKQRGKTIPLDLPRRLKIWPTGLETTHELFEEFAKESKFGEAP